MTSVVSTRRLQAILLVIAACFVLAGMDALGKHLMRELPAIEVVWARYAFHTLLVTLLFAPRHHHLLLRPRHAGVQLLRGACLLGVTLGVYLAIRRIPLGEATAILFLAPVLVTLMAARWLAEPVRAAHLLALALGLGGVLLIVRPGFRDFDPALLLALGAAVLLALYFVLTRWLQGRDHTVTTLFHTTATGALALSATAPLWWVPPAPGDWPALAGMGLLGATGHLMLIRAFHLHTASALSPWLNAQVAAAALYGMVLFDETPGLPFAAGAGLIVAAGLLAHRASRSDRPAGH